VSPGRRKVICQWRVAKAEPSGLMVWFDPDTELVRLYELEHPETSGVEGFSEGDDYEVFPPESESDKQMFFNEELP